jgi:DUF2075 family protein
MILYAESKSQFHADVRSNVIDTKIESDFRRVLGRRPPAGEVASWRNSLVQMHLMLEECSIPNNCRVAIEYMPPLSSKRIDFILAGRGHDGVESLVIVELKQWERLEASSKQDIVRTFVGGGVHDQAHPSYQAWTYAQLLMDFSVPVTSRPIRIAPCVYMHNLLNDEVIRDRQYAKVLDDAPVFLRGEMLGLRSFIEERVYHGDDANIVQLIDSGEIRPSKKLADSVAKMLAGNREFTMIDEQKVVYESVRALAYTRLKKKQVVIVKGGPGTGKSVVAINLLVNLLSADKNTCYVSKNAAPRDVYKDKLASGLRKTRINQLFVGSGSFTETRKDAFDVLLVDEAHRLNEKSGMYRNMGENQIKEAIHASKCTVFFLDEDQRVALTDVGSAEEIAKWAERYDANVSVLELTSQFRCGGSDGYLSWLDRMLQISDTANFTLDGIPFDFRVFDDPSEMHSAITSKNTGGKTARTVAGYCWKWYSKKDPTATDINLGDFRKKWNLSSEGNSWIIRPDSIDEIGCIHTCQGLEMDYVGVIIGKDLVVRDGVCTTDPSARARDDRTISGYKAQFRKDPTSSKDRMDKIIKNTYRVLMTRGMKGCYLYCEDAETREYFKSGMAGTS